MKFKKMIILITVILIVINLTLFIYSYQTYLEINQKKEELDLLKQYQNYTTGDKYNLHNPTFQEAISFLKNDTYFKSNITINNAKNNGINCSYVQIIMGKELYMYELIGFNTIDKEMVYFEMDGDYQVNPILGEKYSNCVIDYKYNLSFNDTIIDIINIW